MRAQENGPGVSLIPAGRGRGSGERVTRVQKCGLERGGASSSSAVCPAGSGVVSF